MSKQGSALAKKLRLLPGQRALILNAPETYRDLLGDLPEGVELVEQPEDEVDFVQVFVKNSEDLDALAPQAIEAVKYDGLLWVSYPKKSSKVKTDLSRDILWELLKPTGLRPVTQVSIDEVWSALRFRPAERVGR